MLRAMPVWRGSAPNPGHFYAESPLLRGCNPQSRVEEMECKEQAGEPLAFGQPSMEV